MTAYVTKSEFTRQKSRLTRAKNSGDPLKVLDAVNKTLDEWSGKAWPDDWAIWRAALEDAFWKFTRSADYFESPYRVARFHETFDRFHR